ncbi:unnamed protein product [Schistocephalus solidus]|uniref:Reverse transcriptase n=1 Tax=Schistocephalus solidus TaxID=70667 RepID=A0A183SMZ0_SCHSO|nr:unnamed protein product [Schistocephalus solidus]
MVKRLMKILGIAKPPLTSVSTLQIDSASPLTHQKAELSQLAEQLQFNNNNTLHPKVVNAPVAASNWYATLTCGSSKLGSSKRPQPGQPSRPADPRSNRPERRTALVAWELARYKVDIADFSETRFSEQGQLE